MLALRWDSAEAAGVLRSTGGALTNSGFELETAIILSLALDAAATEEDGIASTELRRGWWGDAFAEVPGDKIGSRLWTLERAKATNETRLKIEKFAFDALRWLVEDRVVAKIVTRAYFTPTKIGMLSVDVFRPGEVKATSYGPWEAIRAV